MTHLEIERAKDLGFALMHSKVGHILWRRQGRTMSAVHVRTGTEIEMDYEQENRVELPRKCDLKGNQEWAEDIMEWKLSVDKEEGQ